MVDLKIIFCYYTNYKQTQWKEVLKMQGYATIGTMYSLREQNSDKSLIWAVIENDSNDNTSTLLVVEDCPKKGKQVKVDATWLYEREPIGPILPPNGEIVIEHGIEFVRPIREEVKPKMFVPQKK